MRTYAEVQTEIAWLKEELARAESEAKEALAREVPAARKRINEIMKAANLTVDDVLSDPKPIDKTKLQADKPTRAPAKPLYQDPQSKETWSGRGRCPRWLKGLDREQYRIPATQ